MMKGDAVLEYAEFQVNPSRMRCDLVVSSNGVVEKLASGFLKPFLTHLQAVEDQVSGGCKSVRLEYCNVVKDAHGKSWFTKGTLERFVRFVSTPEILESVKSIDDEMTLLRQAWTTQVKNYAQGKSSSMPSNTPFPRKFYNADSAVLERDGSPSVCSSYRYDGVDLDAENSKVALLNAMDARLISMQQELQMAFTRAAAAGFSGPNMADLIAFSYYFGAHRLREACCDFLGIYKRMHLGSTNVTQSLETDSGISLSSTIEIDMESSYSSDMLTSLGSLTSTKSGLFGYESVGTVEESCTSSTIGAAESLKMVSGVTDCDPRDQFRVKVENSLSSISRDLAENKLLAKLMSSIKLAYGCTVAHNPANSVSHGVKCLDVNKGIDGHGSMETVSQDQISSRPSFHMNDFFHSPTDGNSSSSWVGSMDQHIQTLMSIIDSQTVVDDNDSSLQSGRLYEHYRSVRHAKLMERRDSKNVEREAKLKSMVETLAKEKEEMDAQVFKTSKKISCSGRVHSLKECDLDAVIGNDRNTTSKSGSTPVSKGKLLIPKPQGLRKPGTFHRKGASSPSLAITVNSARKSWGKSCRFAVSKDSPSARPAPSFDHIQKKNAKRSHLRQMDCADVNSRNMTSIQPSAADEVARLLKAKLNVAIGAPCQKERFKPSSSARNRYAPKSDLRTLPLPRRDEVLDKKGSAKCGDTQRLKICGSLCDEMVNGVTHVDMNSDQETILEAIRASNMSSNWDFQYRDPMAAKRASFIPNPPPDFRLREDQLTGNTRIKAPRAFSVLSPHDKI